MTDTNITINLDGVYLDKETLLFLKNHFAEESAIAEAAIKSIQLISKSTQIERWSTAMLVNSVISNLNLLSHRSLELAQRFDRLLSNSERAVETN